MASKRHHEFAEPADETTETTQEGQTVADAGGNGTAGGDAPQQPPKRKAAEVVAEWAAKRAEADAMEEEAVAAMLERGCKGGVPFLVGGKMYTVRQVKHKNRIVDVNAVEE